MFKLIGSIFIITSTTFLSSKPIIESYITYKFLQNSILIINKICFEKNSNEIYEKIYKKIGFQKTEFLKNIQESIYINKEVQKKLTEFFNSIGTKNRMAENEYIDFFLADIEKEKNYYYKKYTENKKLYILYGFSIGIFLIIILI